MSVIDLFSLKGKTALVSGCKRGIGMAMAQALAEAGANIIGVSANLELEGSDISKQVRLIGREFYAYQCDFGNREALHSFTQKVLSEHPVIDQTAPFILTREIGKRMIESGGGKIIFTASLLTFQGGINVPGYAASKGAIGQLTKAFANEWASKGINVNAIAPGYIATDNTTALREDEGRSRSIIERIPAARWGEATDFKGPIVFLASEASSYMHGHVLTVDGGWMGR
jgi:2-deoxy-D-gluconate 3-dehydrogenase